MPDNLIPGGNNNVTSGQNQPSKLGDALSNLLGSDTNPVDQHLSSFYVQSGSTGTPGVTDAPGGGLIAHGIDSIFNPFYIFRYAKYGEIGGETYYGEYHRDINSTSLNSQIKNIIQGESDPYFVIYGDTYFNLDLAEVFKQYNPKLDSPLMVIYKNSDKYDISNVKLINQRAFYSKSNPPEGCEYIDYGIGIFQAKHFNGFEGNFDLSEVQEYFSRKYSLQYFVANERFYEIGSLSGLKEFKGTVDHDLN